MHPQADPQGAPLGRSPLHRCGFAHVQAENGQPVPGYRGTAKAWWGVLTCHEKTSECITPEKITAKPAVCKPAADKREALKNVIGICPPSGKPKACWQAAHADAMTLVSELKKRNGNSTIVAMPCLKNVTRRGLQLQRGHPAWDMRHSCVCYLTECLLLPCSLLADAVKRTRDPVTLLASLEAMVAQASKKKQDTPRPTYGHHESHVPEHARPPLDVRHSSGHPLASPFFGGENALGHQAAYLEYALNPVSDIAIVEAIATRHKVQLAKGARVDARRFMSSLAAKRLQASHRPIHVTSTHRLMEQGEGHVLVHLLSQDTKQTELPPYLRDAEVDRLRRLVDDENKPKSGAPHGGGYDHTTTEAEEGEIGDRDGGWTVASGSRGGGRSGGGKGGGGKGGGGKGGGGKGGGRGRSDPGGLSPGMASWADRAQAVQAAMPTPIPSFIGTPTSTPARLGNPKPLVYSPLIMDPGTPIWFRDAATAYVWTQGSILHVHSGDGNLAAYCVAATDLHTGGVIEHVVGPRGLLLEEPVYFEHYLPAGTGDKSKPGSKRRTSDGEGSADHDKRDGKRAASQPRDDPPLAATSTEQVPVAEQPPPAHEAVPTDAERLAAAAYERTKEAQAALRKAAATAPESAQNELDDSDDEDGEETGEDAMDLEDEAAANALAAHEVDAENSAKTGEEGGDSEPPVASGTQPGTETDGCQDGER